MVADAESTEVIELQVVGLDGEGFTLPLACRWGFSTCWTVLPLTIRTRANAHTRHGRLVCSFLWKMWMWI